MDPTPVTEVTSVLILKTDRFCAESLRQLALKEFPAAQVQIAASAERAARMLRSNPVDLLIVGTETSPQGDMVELIIANSLQTARARRLFVVTSFCEDRIIALLRSLSVQGVFDCAFDPPEQLAIAMRFVASGARYWSPSLVQRIQQHHLSSESLFRRLTPTEQLILCVVGDGSDDMTAGETLGLSPSTVSTVRRKLHRKLGVQQRGELVRVAAQNGFVRFTAAGVSRPGFAILAAAHKARKGRDAA